MELGQLCRFQKQNGRGRVLSAFGAWERDRRDVNTSKQHHFRVNAAKVKLIDLDFAAQSL